jgi:hypothetical protein
MSNSISRVQKICMFTGAFLFASLNVVCGIFAIKNGFGCYHYHLYWSGAVVFSCGLVVAIVLGAWVGGLICGLWRSPPGEVLLRTWSGGVLGSILAAGGAAQWLLRGQPATREQFAMDLIVVGGVILAGTLLGLSGGYLARRRTRQMAGAIDHRSVSEDVYDFGKSALSPALAIGRASAAFAKRLGWRKGLVVAILFIVIAIGAVLGWPIWERAAADSELRRTIEATNQAEPDGWTFEDFERC